ncbi:MAG TPA: glycosyltransferase family 39 protein [Acetobacteraceae bacterium]|nr:glycosyltransferase family 39 protein [Acetobacteraceae bacterium]
MTTASPPATVAPDTPRRALRAVAATDLLSLAVLFSLFGALLLPLDRLPMLMVDESRNALNALGMDLHGHWLVPYYAGAPDHWNTKPPLLIWVIAALLRLGAAPLVALRLPSLLAAAGTLLAAWWFCRHVLADARGAMLSGMLLLTSSLYMGPHVARSGDYDTLLCAFLLGQVLAFWIAIETAAAISPWPFAAFAACVVGAVLTKAIEGALLLPGLLLFAVLRGRLLALLRDPRVWLLTLAAVAVCLGYYLTRPLYDPGYLTAVWHNELGGRFAAVRDRSTGGPLYYVIDTVRRFEPGLLLLPLAGFSLASNDPRRRSAVLLLLLTSAVLLLVIVRSATKHFWYAAPMIPLLSIAAGIGTADALCWLSRHAAPRARLAPVALGVLLACAAAVCVARNQVWSVRGLRAQENDQFWYGNFLDGLRESEAAHQLTVLDSGLPNRTGFVDYNPMLQFYAAWETQHGMPVALREAGGTLTPGSEVATCDPAAMSWLAARHDVAIMRRTSACILARVTPQRGADAG